MVKLDAEKAGGPFELSIIGKNKIVITNVLVGEVWICSGQSNMEFQVSKTMNSEKEIKDSNYPMIRHFGVAQDLSGLPKEDLKAGKMRWFEAVDLHGCTVEQARAAVLQIIQIAKDANQNVIKIVHGKGPEAILKTYVNGWLRQHRDVLAFVSAPENQGGTGAVLVLLKRAEKIQSTISNRQLHQNSIF